MVSGARQAGRSCAPINSDVRLQVNRLDRASFPGQLLLLGRIAIELRRHRRAADLAKAVLARVNLAATGLQYDLKKLLGDALAI